MSETSEATSIFAPLWRRKWLILAVAILAGVVTYFYYKGKTPTYQSSTQVYLGAGAEETAPGEKAKAASVSATDQVAIINSIVVEGVRIRLRKEGDTSAAKGIVKAKVAGEKSQFITITAEASRGRSAALLANSVASAYVRRQHLYYQRSILTAISIARRQLRKIEAAAVPATPPKTSASKSGSSTSSTPAASSAPSTSSVLQSANLESRINQLESELAVTGVQQVKPARPNAALLLSPKPRKNAVFGFFVGLLLAAAAAYVLSRFDRRLRSLAAIEGGFGVPVLSALPSVRRPVVNREGRPSPSGPLLEPLRRLHANLELLEAARRGPSTNGGPGRPCVILFTSADSGDGKSTLVADLALVQSEAGERVAVVEANLRRPVLATLLRAAGPYGLSEVLNGTLPVDNAMQGVVSAEAYANGPAQSAPEGGVATAVDSPAHGSLSLLAGGAAVGNPGALLASSAMEELLRGLAESRDYVLIDAPSPLEVSDAMPLLPLVDGIVIVAREGHTREASADRLVQLLRQASSAKVLGVVANGVSPADIARSGFSTPRPARRTLAR